MNKIEREAIFRLHRIHCLSWQKGGVAAVQATDERWRVARGNVSRRRKRIPSEECAHGGREERYN